MPNFTAEDALRNLKKIQSPTPTPSTIPSVVQPSQATPTPPQPTSLGGKIKQAGLAGLGVVGKVLNAPSQFTETLLTGGKGYGEGVGPTIARLALDPLNLISFGTAGVARLGLKGLSKVALKEVGQAGIEQLGKLATKEGEIALTKAAGKQLAEHSTQVGEEAARTQMLKRIAQGETNLIDKGGIKVGIPFKEGKTIAPLPDLGTTIKPAIASLASKVPQPVRDLATNIGTKVKQAVEYPLNRAPKGVSEVVDKFGAEKQRLYDMADNLVQNYTKIAPESRQLVDDVLRGTTKLTQHENPIVQQAINVRNTIDNLGQRAVKAGLISKETYQAGQGSYLPRLYKLFLEDADLSRGIPEAKRITGEEFSRTMQRTDVELQKMLDEGKISQEHFNKGMQNFQNFQKAGGQVTNPAYLAAKALQGVGGLVTKAEQFGAIRPYGVKADELAAKFLKGKVDAKLNPVLRDFRNPTEAATTESELLRFLQNANFEGKEGKRAAVEAARRVLDESVSVEFKGQKLYQLPQSKALGELSGIYVPEAIHTYLTEGSGRFLSTNAGKALMLLSAPFGFKAAKTTLSVGSQVRNFLSNQILNFLQDPGSFRQFRQAFKVVKNPADPRFEEMRKAGLFVGRFVGEEVGKFYKKIDNLENLDDLSFLTRVRNIAASGANKAGDIRDFAENWAKAQQYLHARSLGASIEEAKRIAESTIFAYQKVGPAVRIARATAVPFLTFTIKAVPFIAKQGLKNPRRLALFPKAEQGVMSIFGVNEAEQQYLPDWMQGMIPLPIKDESGNTLYFNPKYIYPWGQVMGSDVQPLPGLPFIGKGGQLPGGVSLAPTFTEAASQISGRDLFTGEEFVRQSQTSGQQVRARVERVAKTFTPSAVAGAVPFLPGATSTTKSQKERGLGLTELGANAGLQLQPFNLRQGIESNKKAAEAIRRETTTEVNRAIKAGKSPEEIKQIRLRGIQRLRDLQAK